MKKKFKINQGFTLVEIILYMVLLSIFLLTLVDVLVSVLDVQLESQATSAVDFDSRYITSRLNYDISRSSAISMPANLGDTSGSLVLTIGGASYTYSLSGGDLVLDDSASSENLNSSESQITFLSFQKVGNSGGHDTVKVNFTIQSQAVRTSGPEVRNIETTIGAR